LGLFAGLNILPTKSYATDYAYRTQRPQQQQLLSGWVAELAPVLFPEAQAFGLDFPPLPYRGEPEALANQYLPLRGKAGPSLLTFFAHEPTSRVLCYANANLTRTDQPGERMRFVEFWHAITGRDPQWLYFDSKLVPDAELARVNARHIWFVTIRRRGRPSCGVCGRCPPRTGTARSSTFPNAATRTSAISMRLSACGTTRARCAS
jgi:hypothetical protein